MPAQIGRVDGVAGRLERRAEMFEGPAAAEGAVHHDDGGHLSLSPMLARAF
jgi:hypothetical protein